MFSQRNALMFLATGAGAGRVPFAPGTVGSLVGVAIAWLLSRLPCPAAAAVLIALIPAAAWVAQHAEQALGRKDPGCIVIDEIVGVCVTLVCIPMSLWSALAGFLLFRLFDIAKPPPIRHLERRLTGGWGVVLDDVAAGIIAHVLLRIGLALNS
jgi:phosphatidylglycerophosphatase A